MSTLYIRNVAAIDHDYVYTEQQTSWNGVDWDVTAEWKHLRNESSVRMANEWCSIAPRSIEIKDGNSEDTIAAEVADERRAEARKDGR